MTDYEMVAGKIREGMVQGNMHGCLRDTGRLAGGMQVAGRLSASDCESLGRLAVSLSLDKELGKEKWDKAVEYGKRDPAPAVRMARQGSQIMDWDTVLDLKIVDTEWLETESIEEPSGSWNGCRELSEYINLLFQADEYIGFNVEAFKRDNGKYSPYKRGVYHYKAGQILTSLRSGKIEDAIGTVNPEAGAWIRFNPLDGKGESDKNVTDYRYALVEADDDSIEKQVAIYRKLELPCVCIVNSGGKSAHAIVKIYANDIEDYRKKVDFLYEACSQNGLKVDRQNRNPSRYSRMPGVMRGGHKQFIIDRNCGKENFEEWKAWIEEVNDDLPDFEEVGDIYNPPPLAKEQIEGILRVGHKMCIAGPSKAGKSFALIELTIAIAEGAEWFGHKCRQGKVLYINLELDKASCINRFAAVYKSLGIPPTHAKDFIRMWNLRGRTMPLDKLSPKLIRRAKDEGFAMIIIDPIYKVLTGDENSASEMANFCNNFDRIGRDCGCAIVYCHHHSKGAQGGKRSMDRASGSGVFARDPDALIDLLPLESENARSVLSNEYECRAMLDAVEYLPGDIDISDISEDTSMVSDNLFVELDKRIEDQESMDVIRKARSDAMKVCDSATAWRASFTLREFASPKPLNLWFIYPKHFVDDLDILVDVKPEGDDFSKYKKKQPSNKKEDDKKDKMLMFRQDVAFNPGKHYTISELAKMVSVTDRTIRNYCKQCGYIIKNGRVYLDED